MQPGSRAYRVTYLTPEGEKWQHYFTTGGFADPAKLNMSKEEAGEYCKQSNKDKGEVRIVRVVRLWSWERD